MNDKTTHPALRAAIVTAAAMLVIGCSKEQPSKVIQPARAVTVAEVELRPIKGHVSASGLLVPREEAAVGVELAGFRVKDVLVEEGAVVKAGQPLAYLDDTLLRSKVAQAKASYDQERSQADRANQLREKGVLSVEQIDLQNSEAEVAKAQYRDLTTQAERMTIRAPVDGLVIERAVRPGSVSGGAEPMFRIARDQLIELDAEVLEDAVSGIEQGSLVSVSLPGGKSFDGEVRLISPRVDPQTKLGRVRVKLPVDSDLRPGGFAKASFQREAESVPAVPEKAVQFEASGPLITVIGEDNRATRQSVRTGGRANGYVELIDGPPVGTRVALGGGAFLLDGDLVDPHSTTAAKPVTSSPANKPETDSPTVVPEG